MTDLYTLEEIKEALGSVVPFASYHESILNTLSSKNKDASEAEVPFLEEQVSMTPGEIINNKSFPCQVAFTNHFNYQEVRGTMTDIVSVAIDLQTYPYEKVYYTVIVDGRGYLLRSEENPMISCLIKRFYTKTTMRNLTSFKFPLDYHFPVMIQGAKTPITGTMTDVAQRGRDTVIYCADGKLGMNFMDAEIYVLDKDK